MTWSFISAEHSYASLKFVYDIDSGMTSLFETKIFLSSPGLSPSEKSSILNPMGFKLTTSL